jgi:ketosteroid isomerase-like protein
MHGLMDTCRMMADESTTPGLIELARRAVDAANRRDFDAVMSYVSPDSVWEGWMGTTFTGREAIRGNVEDVLGTFEEFVMEPEELLELGGGVVLGVALQSVRLAGSGDEHQGRVAFVSEWVNGLIVRVMIYPNIEDGRAAAERLAEERGM